MNLGVADAGWGTGAGKVTSCRGKGLCLLNLVVLVCSLTALHSSMLLAFTFFLSFLLSPWRRPILFFTTSSLPLCFSTACRFLPSLSLDSTRLDLVLGAEQGREREQGTKWKKERQYIHGLGCDAFGPENENENVERVHVVAGFFYSTFSEL